MAVLDNLRVVNILRVSGREMYATSPSTDMFGASSRNKLAKGGKWGAEGMFLKMLSSSKGRLANFTCCKVEKDDKT